MPLLRYAGHRKLLERNQYLDLLRALAILLVLGMHFRHFSVLNKIGGNGVDLFFVLSGYLISGLLFREYSKSGNIRIARFLLRRGLKLWPALYVYLAIMMIPLGMHTWRALPPAALFYSNYVPPIAGVFGHTWSLAIEEHFYIVLPFVLAWMMRRGWLSHLPALYLVIAALCGIARYLEPGFADHATHCRIDSLLLGVLLSYWHDFRPRIFAKLKNLPVALFLIIAAWTLPLGVALGDLLIAWGFALLLAWGVDRQVRVPLLPQIGVYSYSIYLWQQPFAVSVVDQQVGLAKFCVLLLAAILLGIGMARLIEIPVLRLRDRLLPSGIRKASCDVLAPSLDRSQYLPKDEVRECS